MKLNIILEIGFQNLEHKAAQLLARGARKPLPPPDGPDGMLTSVSLGDNDAKQSAKCLAFAQSLFHGRHFLIGERIVQVAIELVTRNLAHGASSFSSGKTSTGSP